MLQEAMKKCTFYDLCVSEEIVSKNIKMFTNLGYKAIAVNKTVNEEIFQSKKKTKNVDPKECIDVIPKIYEYCKESNLDLVVLNRLTIQMGDISVCSKLNQSENFKKYDILAVMPMSAAAFNHACTTMDVDIICFSAEEPGNWKINRKLYKQAVERGIYFEIMYAPALKDSTCRKNIIQRSHYYHTIGKSANIVITSGAETIYQLRSPYDIINLGQIFGLNDQLSKKSITESAQKVLLKADNRKRGRSAVFFTVKEENKQTCEDTQTLEPKFKKLKTDT